MTWNWFPLDAGTAIQRHLHRRALLDDIRIRAEHEYVKNGGPLDHLPYWQRLLVDTIVADVLDEQT